MSELSREITMPDGVRVRLEEWRHEAYYSHLGGFLHLDGLEDGDVYVQLPYTIRSGETPPEPITLAEFARRFDAPLWRLLCNVNEYRARARRGRNVGRIWCRLHRMLYRTLMRARYVPVG